MINYVCVTPFDFFPVIKQVTQFLIIPFPSNERKKCFISKTCFTCKRESESESYHTNTHKPKISQSSTNRDTKRNVYLLGQAGIYFLFFPNTDKLYPPFLLYLSPYCNPSAYGLGLANWRAR